VDKNVIKEARKQENIRHQQSNNRHQSLRWIASLHHGGEHVLGRKTCCTKAHAVSFASLFQNSVSPKLTAKLIAFDDQQKAKPNSR